MKNQKLKLHQLEVKSFVTGLENSHVNTVKGGADFGIKNPGGGEEGPVTIATVNDAYCRDTGPAKCLAWTGKRGCTHCD